MGMISNKLLDQMSIKGFAPNLFEVEFRLKDGTPDPSSPDGTLYCTGYELPPPSVDIKQNPLTKEHYVEKYTIPEIVSVTWQEDSSLAVWRYHQDWMNSIYNRGYDVFITGARRANKKRQICITIQRFTADRSKLNSDLENSYQIILKGVLPKSIPAFRGEWNSDAERGSTGLTMQYFVDFIKIIGYDDQQNKIPAGTGTI
jgi:hypothetical protein